jgi:hypothetical protein
LSKCGEDALGLARGEPLEPEGERGGGERRGGDPLKGALSMGSLIAAECGIGKSVKNCSQAFCYH